MTTLVVLGVGYVILVVFVLAILTAAKRGDMAAQARAPEGSVETLPAHAVLGRVVADVCEALDAERVTVVLSDPDEPASGVVGACFGVPGLVGSRVPVEGTASVGVVGPAEAAALGLARGPETDATWTFARVPIAGTHDILGAVTVARRRSRAFTERDLIVIERAAGRCTRRFDRRRHPASTGDGARADFDSRRVHRPA